MARIRVGLSGWSYRDWAGAFYPEGQRPPDHLRFVAGVFDTVEVNRTFYSLVTAAAYRSWYETVPADFCFAVKGSRYITHQKKLREAERPLANFLASGVLQLGDKLGPILWQLPGNWRFDAGRVGTFLAMLPKTTEEAAALALRHDERISEPVIPPVSGRPIRHVLEVRHPTAFDRELVEVARMEGVAIAFSHATTWPYTEEPTADFVYLRLHGPGALYSSRYGPDELDRWAARLEAWHAGGEPADPVRITDLPPPLQDGRDVYVYFDNDVAAYAPENARALRERLDTGEGGRRPGQ